MIAARFRVWLLATVLLCIASFGVAEREFGQLTFALVLAAAGWAVTERRASARRDWIGLPRWFANCVLVAALLAAAYRVYRGAEPVSAFGTFLTAIIVLKLWEQRRTPDYGQVLSLSVFLAIGAALTDNSLALGLVLAATLPTLVVTAMLYQVTAAAAHAAGQGRLPDADHATTSLPPPPPPTLTPTPTPTLDSRLAWRAVRRASAVTTVAGLVLAVFVFLLVPRGIGMSSLGALGRPTLGRATGFTDSVNLGVGGSISESQTQVLELRVTSEPSGNELGGNGQPFYLRGAVLDTYDRGRWIRAPSGADPLAIPLRGLDERVAGRASVEPTDAFVLQTVTLWRTGPDSPLFTAWRPITISVDGPGDLRVETDVGRIVRFGEPGIVTYRVRSRPDPAPTGAWQRRPVPDSPAPDSPIGRYAAEILRRSNLDADPQKRSPDDDALAVRALESHLRSSFAYTLSPQPAPIGRDPTEWFLTTERRGHCEYYASGLALLCRAIGVNSRVVSGYLAYEYDASRGAYTVRESNAHAWVEAQVTRHQWRTYDGTPPAWLEEHHGPPTTILARLWRILDRADSAWNGSVVTFDERVRSRIIGEGLIPASWVRQGGLFAAFRNVEPEAAMDTARTWLFNVLLALLGVGAAVLGIVMWRARRTTDKLADGWAFDPRSPEGRAYASLIARLRRRGRRKPGWQPLRDFVAHAAHSDPGCRAAVEAADLLAASRFGGRPFDTGAFRDALRRVQPGAVPHAADH